MVRRSRSLIVGGALLLALAGCGGSRGEPTVTTSSAPDPGLALRALAAAARAGDEDKLRSLVTASTPTDVVRELFEGLGSFPATTKVILAEPIDARWAVAALAGRRSVEGVREFGAFAVALKHVGRGFQGELGSRVRIRPLGPDPGSVQAPGQTQIAAEFSAPVKIVQGGLWLDGTALSGTTAGTPRRYTAYAASPPLTRGPHVMVAFAEAGGHATALAWTFRVR